MTEIDHTQIKLEGDWLTVHWEKPHTVVSWAVIGGGVGSRTSAVWHQVNNADLSEDVDPVKLFQDRLIQKELDGEKYGDGVVGFLTSAKLSNYSLQPQTRGNQWVRCLATVGLSNSVRVGTANKVHLELPKVGTINLLVQTSGVLSLSASLEAMSITSEARTLAVLEAKIPSFEDGNLATGTGTDCIAVASAQGPSPSLYAGKHTLWGQLIGQAVYDAVSDGIRKWKLLKSAQ